LSGYELPAISKWHNVGSNFGQKIEKKEYENLILHFVSFVICLNGQSKTEAKKPTKSKCSDLTITYPK
jgi:hypothetical protein